MLPDAAEALKRRLRADIKTAMQDRNAPETRLLRALLAAIDNAQAVPLEPADRSVPSNRFDEGASEVPRLALTEGTLHAVLAAEIAERERAADDIARHGRTDDAARLRAEALVVRRYFTP